jgi:hypothetical protein
MAGWSLRLVRALMAKRQGVRRSAANAPVMAWAGRWSLQAGPGCQWESGARGRGVEPLTGGAGLSGAARAHAARPLGPWEERGGGSAGATQFGPKSAQPRGKGFFFFLFLFSISFFHFLFFFFLFPFCLNQQFAK